MKKLSLALILLILVAVCYTLLVMKRLGNKKVALSGHRGAGKFTLVDEDYDGEYFSQFKWYLSPKGYAIRTTYDKGARETIYLHHEVLRNCPAGMRRDHINRDKLDNRSDNLRVVSPTQNHLNTSYKRNKKDNLPVGVFKSGNKYQLNFRSKYVGTFNSIKEATERRDELLQVFLGV